MLVVLVIGAVVTVPTYAITFSWSMSTNGRLVDGSKNGVYHKLSYGHVKIKGSIHTYSNKNGNGYYLYIWRADSDGTSLSASGTAYHYDYNK